MIIIPATVLAVILIAALTIFIARLVNSSKNKIDTKKGVQESIYIDINGMQQYIQIRGEDTDNPVMIFIHGGPASPMGWRTCNR